MFAYINQKYSDYHFRYLEQDDYHREVFQTLGELTKAPKPTYKAFREHLLHMKNSAQIHVNIVGIDKKDDKVVAFGTLLVCNSILGLSGKIQNIVTCSAVRGKGLGRCIIELLQVQAFEQKCTRVSLFCQNKNVKFYEKLGFVKEGQIFACYRK